MYLSPSRSTAGSIGSPDPHLLRKAETRGPFLKWTGGKAKLLPQLLPLLPEGQRLIEPFVGAGSVFLSTDYDGYVIGDTNSDLIAVYVALQCRPYELIERAQQFFVEDNRNREAYLRIRAEFNTLADSFERAVRFPYLNRHAFNGLFRTNNRGEFNVSYADPKTVPNMRIERMLAAAAKLRSTVVMNGGFEGTLDMAGPGDVVYCDPPYLDSTHGQSFTKYGANGFGPSRHKRLVECCIEANRRGATVLISNHDTAETRELYRGWETVEVEVRRTVAAKVEARRMVGELVAMLPAGGKHVAAVSRTSDVYPVALPNQGSRVEPPHCKTVFHETSRGNELEGLPESERAVFV